MAAFAKGWAQFVSGGAGRENRSGGFPARNVLILSDLHLNLRPACGDK
jgi:hypothetical protein